ncbi:hypothetical protein [Actinomadura soli]|uniref:hypothetical protein n=1 Tax=Actinomadura soli TaxID=2508997 RepID=UPI0014874417|nr:hypothetical protein [Actinomadura soli]
MAVGDGHGAQPRGQGGQGLDGDDRDSQPGRDQAGVEEWVRTDNRSLLRQLGAEGR